MPAPEPSLAQPVHFKVQPSRPVLDKPNAAFGLEQTPARPAPGVLQTAQQLPQGMPAATPGATCQRAPCGASALVGAAACQHLRPSLLLWSLSSHMLQPATPSLGDVTACCQG